MPRIADSFSRGPLTRRKNGVLHLLAEECCDKTIARRLGIDERDLVPSRPWQAAPRHGASGAAVTRAG